jgi:competence protein ComEC
MIVLRLPEGRHEEGYLKMTEPEKKFAFSVIDVGQGSFQLLEIGDGDCIVFDCNLKGAPEYVSRYLGRRKIKRIVLLVISGTDEDHADVDGLRMLSGRYEIERVWIPDFPKDTDNWKEFRRVLSDLEREGTKVEKPSAGHEGTVGEIELKVLGPHPDDSDTSNNASLVVKHAVGKAGLLVTGDCEDKRWESILKYFKKWLPSDILIAPHHGSDHGCVEEVVEAVSPLYTIVSVGADNKYGHPDKGAIAIYERLTRKQVFVTKDDGSILIEFTRDGIVNVVPDAGRDPEGIKEEESNVARALRSGAPIFITSSGTPSTSPERGAPYRPTHFHGGEKAEATAEGDQSACRPKKLRNK